MNRGGRLPCPWVSGPAFIGQFLPSLSPPFPFSFPVSFCIFLYFFFWKNVIGGGCTETETERQRDSSLRMMSRCDLRGETDSTPSFPSFVVPFFLYLRGKRNRGRGRGLASMTKAESPFLSPFAPFSPVVLVGLFIRRLLSYTS